MAKKSHVSSVEDEWTRDSFINYKKIYETQKKTLTEILPPLEAQHGAHLEGNKIKNL